MNSKSTQEEHLSRISELKTLHDNIQNAERELAGLANMRGFELRGINNLEDNVSRKQSYARKLARIKVYFNPTRLLFKGLKAVLERTHLLNTKNARKLFETAEELVCLGYTVYKLPETLSAANPIGLLLQGAEATVGGAEFVLNTKIRSKLSILSKLKDKEPMMKHTMEQFWNASMEFRRLSPIVLKELNQEIDRWQA
jgi:hypothetical protein